LRLCPLASLRETVFCERLLQSFHTELEVLYVLNTGLLYSVSLAKEQVGRSLLAFLGFDFRFGSKTPGEESPNTKGQRAR